MPGKIIDDWLLCCLLMLLIMMMMPCRQNNILDDRTTTTWSHVCVCSVHGSVAYMYAHALSRNEVCCWCEILAVRSISFYIFGIIDGPERRSEPVTYIIQPPIAPFFGYFFILWRSRNQETTKNNTQPTEQRRIF